MLRNKIRRLLDLQSPLKLEREIAQLRAQVDFLAEQLDRVKSSLEVSGPLFEELTEWRARTPIPEAPLKRA